MAEYRNDTDFLLTKIKDKRHKLAAYLAKSEPHYTRLINFSLISGALAASLTAGPGIAGNGFVDIVTATTSFGAPIWQILCLLATILSISTVIMNSMLKSHSLTTKINSARSCDAKLEGLETMLELSQINVEQATPLYTQCLTEIPHV